MRSKGVAAISGNYMFRGVEAVAAPVFNFKNELTMSIVLVGVEGSIDMRDESPVIAHLKDAAHSLSQRLGSTRETRRPPRSPRLPTSRRTSRTAPGPAPARLCSLAPLKSIHKIFLTRFFVSFLINRTDYKIQNLTDRAALATASGPPGPPSLDRQETR